LIATSTDYDAWRPQEASVTVHDVLQTLHDNATTSRRVVETIVGELHLAIEQGLLDEEKGGMKNSMLPVKIEGFQPDAKLKFILPEYFA
jgi:5'-methylthioadenosine phosphorylase